ncbi:homoserine dehydrogenase [Basilea psittacipulmonis]|uniref:Homoserine dehydrogenase n=1 Tax=Basilea psittacipulmonis DSM 24701 TaxID=1072685 RepID=A0A077DI34_9BURK|nr:homoserine dehydrogenase [Basilea psittacipulmonis]AIL32793.1 homoserine dehydrogenase [Basilea psittacipulmonis DSM 24701]
MTNKIKVGLLGFGVVAGGTYDVLKRNADEITRRAGSNIEVVRIATRTPSKAIGHVDEHIPVTDNMEDVINDPNVDVVVELIGGTTTAKDIVIKAIENGKHVVTANKALLAHYGNEIFALAAEKKVIVAFEAAVAGGIPIIKTMREGLTGNRILWLAGIINGTTNFILSEMYKKGLAYEQVLSEAQRLGYAEADPTFDVEGIDAGHKLSILAAIAFGIPVNFKHVYTEGIREIQEKDISYARRLGYRIKLLGITKHREEGIEMRVHPTLVSQQQLLASVDGAMNAVVVDGDAVGQTLFYGQGAGSEPTASAVVADLVDVARMLNANPEHRVPALAFQARSLRDINLLPMQEVISSYYLRFTVVDRPGVLSEVTEILAKGRISVKSMLQDEEHDGQATIIILTHRAKEGAANEAIKDIESLSCVNSKVVRIRMENFV